MQTILRHRLRHSPGRLSRLLAEATLLIATSLSPVIAGTATIEWLGDVPGGANDYKEALSVSDDGAIVVGYVRDAAGVQRPFRWTNSTGMVLLSSQAGDAEAISGDGTTIVGWHSQPASAVVFESDGMVTGLGDLPGGSIFSQAFATTRDGSVIFGWSSNGQGNHAFRWTSNEGMVALPDLSAGSSQSRPTDVSSDGTTIVGNRRYSAVGAHHDAAFLWTAADGRLDIAGTYPNYSFAEGVSADGEVVVGSLASFGDGGRPFRWDRAQGPMILPPVPFDTDNYGTAFATCDDGGVVVGKMHSRAFIWDCYRSTRNLRLVLNQQYSINPAEPGDLYSANDITPDGRTIVGFGTRGFGIEPWVVRLPCRPGDANGDGAVNGLDIQPIVNEWVNPSGTPSVAACAADLLSDSIINATDINYFIALLTCN